MKNLYFIFFLLCTTSAHAEVACRYANGEAKSFEKYYADYWNRQEYENDIHHLWGSGVEETQRVLDRIINTMAYYTDCINGAKHGSGK